MCRAMAARTVRANTSGLAASAAEGVMTGRKLTRAKQISCDSERKLYLSSNGKMHTMQN